MIPVLPVIFSSLSDDEPLGGGEGGEGPGGPGGGGEGPSGGAGAASSSSSSSLAGESEMMQEETDVFGTRPAASASAASAPSAGVE